jgi:hypothetical protein
MEAAIGYIIIVVASVAEPHAQKTCGDNKAENYPVAAWYQLRV